MIEIIQMQDSTAWNDYVLNHPNSNPYQIFNWQTAISKAYGFKTYGLGAVCCKGSPLDNVPLGKLKGVLPLVHMKSPLSGSRLVSMPYFDHGGVISDSVDIKTKLIQAALDLGEKLKVRHIELRQLEELECLKSDSKPDLQNGQLWDSISLKPNTIEKGCGVSTMWSLKKHKVRLLLQLPASSEALMKSFKSKLRSQISRPLKAGFTAKIGGKELLDDFYHVFSINMRDLGSPVHDKALPICIIDQFKGNLKVVVIYKEHKPAASAIMVGFKDVMVNPWASSLRQHRKESPNMLLYWYMLAYAADHGFRYFDFGRSTPQEGSFRFKVQWGAQAHPMYWYTFFLNRPKDTAEFQYSLEESGKRALAVKLWQKLPISLSRLIGPAIRKHIDL